MIFFFKDFVPWGIFLNIINFIYYIIIPFEISNNLTLKLRTRTSDYHDHNWIYIFSKTKQTKKTELPTPFHCFFLFVFLIQNSHPLMWKVKQLLSKFLSRKIRQKCWPSTRLREVELEIVEVSAAHPLSSEGSSWTQM